MTLNELIQKRLVAGKELGIALGMQAGAQKDINLISKKLMKGSILKARQAKKKWDKEVAKAKAQVGATEKAWKRVMGR
jgi:hypothetical protein